LSGLHVPDPRGVDDWRERAYRVVFGYETKAGRLFDLLLILAILASVAVALMDSVAPLHARHGRALYAIEWAFTLAFTAEYLLRLAIVKHPMRYARSFFGVIDLLAVLPTYLALLVPGAQFLIVLRVLRILRIFSILHLRRYVRESSMLLETLRRSWRRIAVFLLAILALVTIFGAVMYLVEGPAHGFTSIPVAMYWAVVTVGTVGFGDIAPQTPLGRLIASLLILIGYGVIVVPAGIYSAELMSMLRLQRDARECGNCGLKGHEADAKHCRRCGEPLYSGASRERTA
jgi:voltage-gated potassium channel